MKSNILNRIVKNDLCAGCGLCQTICGKKVVMEYNNKGHFRPFTNYGISKEEELLLKKCCPALIIHKDKSLRTLNCDPFWGDYFSCYIGSSKSEEIVNNASSGGVISSILIYLIENKLVDYAIHIGADSNNPFNNVIKISSTAKDVMENANSRYAPTAPLINIIDMIESNKKYVFVGKPCDVAALRQFSFYNEKIAFHVKYYISFFCFGVPSINQTKKLVSNFGVKEEDVETLYYRKDGWPGSFKITTKNGEEFKIPYSEYMHFLFSDIQMRCKICPEGIGESADITCGDGWNEFDVSGYPSFKNSRGKSIIITKTDIGNNLISEIIQNNFLNIHSEINNLREIDKVQPGQLGKKKYFKYRIAAYQLLLRKYPMFDKYIYQDITKISKADFKSKIVQLKGTMFRLLNI